MELKPGYKHSEVGAIPEDWEVIPLGNLVKSVEYGSSAKSNTKGHIPVLRMGNLQEGRIDWNDLVYTDNAVEIAKYSLRSGDVLFNRTNTIDLVGKTSIYLGERPAIFAGYLIRINVNHERLNSRFLNYALNTEIARKYSLKVLSIAVGQANINGQKLKTYPIPIPPTSTEQSAIAEALNDVEVLLSSLDALIGKKHDIKQATMQKLLTGVIRLPGFEVKSGSRLTELGVIPRDWDIRTVSELGTVVTGGTPNTKKTEFWNGDIPWITPTDISEQRDINNSERMLSESGLKAIRPLRENSVLVTCIASIGKNALLRVPGGCNQQINAILPNDSNSPEFLYYLFEKSKPVLLSNAGITATRIISKSVFEEIRLPLPSIKDEQIAIARVLSDMDDELAALRCRRDKTRALKQGMMKELLTGKTRLR